MKHITKLLFILTITFAAIAPLKEAKASPYPITTGYISGYPWGAGWIGLNPLFPVANWAPFGFNYVGYYYRPSNFAAIVHSMTADVSGYAFGQPSIEDAFGAAKSMCNASDCRPIVWVYDGCAAIAVSKADNRLGWAYANTRYNAQNLAMRMCKRGLKVNTCEKRAWVCTH